MTSTPEIPNDMLETPATVSGQLLEKLASIGRYFQTNAVEILWNLMVSVLILLAAKGLLTLISALTKAAMNKPKYHVNPAQGKHIDTLMTLLRSTARYAVYFVAIMLILRQFNLFEDVRGLVVTAGIGSLAIGFGAQNLVKDVVTGFFMMFENQFSVGDYIKTEEAEGTVEATALRVTYLRTFKGEQVIIPNGSISRVVNYSRGDNVAVVTIQTNYEADTRKVMELIARAAEQYARDNADLIKEPPVVQGITNFGASGVDIGLICKVHSMKQWQVERGLRLAVKEMFDRCGVEFPYPHVVTVPYQAPPPVPDADPAPPAAAAARGAPVPDWANIEED